MTIQQLVQKSYCPADDYEDVQKCADECIDFVRKKFVSDAQNGRVYTEKTGHIIKRERKYVLAILTQEHRKPRPGSEYEYLDVCPGSFTRVCICKWEKFHQLENELDRRCRDEGIKFERGTGDYDNDYYFKCYI